MVVLLPVYSSIFVHYDFFDKLSIKKTEISNLIQKYKKYKPNQQQ